MNVLPLGFLLGFLGSMHCAIMCGPLMLSMPYSQNNAIRAALQLLLYQLGRTTTYTALGLLAGLLGSSIKLFASQETLGLVIGGLMIIFTVLYFAGSYTKQFNKLQAQLIGPIGKMMARVYKLSYWGFLAGILNGLIPCGMVYLALATAINAGTVKDATMFMLLFGLGTTPLMLTVSLGGIYLKKCVRFNPNKAIPWFMLMLGAIFILRSTNLAIPFLSPNNHFGNKGHVTECR